MRFLRLTAALTALLTLSSCQLAQAPVDMLGRLFQAGGRTLHMGAATSLTPEEFRLEAKDVRNAIADGAKVELKTQASATVLAQR